MRLTSIGLLIIVSIFVLQSVVEVQSKPLKDEIGKLLPKARQINTTKPSSRDQTTVDTTTKLDDEGTTEYPSYGDDEDDNINSSLAITLAGGGGIG
ncbi:unnamed protein product [Diamesa hyperborea]